MILIVGTVRVPEAAFDTAREAMATMIAETRKEDGCIRYAFAQDVVDKGVMHVSEAWRDRAALTAHANRRTWPNGARRSAERARPSATCGSTTPTRAPRSSGSFRRFGGHAVEPADANAEPPLQPHQRRGDEAVVAHPRVIRAVLGVLGPEVLLLGPCAPVVDRR